MMKLMLRFSFLLLIACDEKNGEKESLNPLETTSVIEVDWKTDSLRVSQWKESPVWICHPDWEELEESYLLNFELYTDSTARFRNMVYDVSDVSVSWDYDGDRLVFWDVEREYRLELLSEVNPRSLGVDVSFLVENVLDGFVWECRSWESFD